jgi:PPOX class probable F420-dependent enzyme
MIAMVTDLNDLSRERYLSLATFRRNGTEVRTPIWVVALGDRLWVVAAGDSGKAKRLRHSSRARIAPCGPRGHITGPWRDVTARIASDPPQQALQAAFVAKYGWQARLLQWMSWLSGRSQRRAWIEIAL